MTLEQLQRLPLYMTHTIEAAMHDADTNAYIMHCLDRYYSGDYGEIPQEDADLNNADLNSGDDHILARYEARCSLTSDIYIESHFCEDLTGHDYNNTVICYVNER